MQNIEGGTSTERLSLIADVGETSSHCGYCERKDESSVTYGMHAEVMSVDTYQELLDR